MGSKNKKITTEQLQEMYTKLWVETPISGARFFRRKKVFEKMAKELNTFIKDNE